MTNGRSNPEPGRRSALALAIGALLAPLAGVAQDQPAPSQPEQPVAQEQAMDEVFAIGRLQTAAESLSMERLEIPFSADFLGADAIGRTGDSDIAMALTRVPGLTLVDSKFVYVRGLGERYSNALVNGAAIPSPDLTRSVVPLDLFPTSVVESIKIQKSPSPDVPAAFGGGVVDIRTRSVPKAPVVDFSIDIGVNNVSDGDVLTFPMDNTPLPAPIAEAINLYGGQIGVSNILNTLRQTNPTTPISEAQAIHQGLIDSLNTNVAITSESGDPDIGGRMILGNSWDVNENWTVGASLLATAGEKYRNGDQFERRIGNPDRFFADTRRSTFEDRSSQALSFGVEYRADHAIEIGTYRIGVDESITSVESAVTANLDEDERSLTYDARTEERELELAQISGRHAFIDTPWVTDFLSSINMQNAEFSWFYSVAEVVTEEHNGSRFQSLATLDETGTQISQQLFPTTTAGQFSFLDLNDEQDSWGGDLTAPFELEKMTLTARGGWWSSAKARSYLQHKVNLNAAGIQSDLLEGTPYDVLSSGDVTVANGFNLTVGGDIGAESYVAAQNVDSTFGMFDLDFESVRFTIGGRWENYRQAVLAFNPLDYASSIASLTEQLTDPEQRVAVQQDDFYPSVAVTLNGVGWLGAADYQFRVSYGETVVRPDLRELAGSQSEGGIVYIDPVLDIRVRGNPFLAPSNMRNFEARSEFYYGSGDNFTIVLFTKDMNSPIETVNQAASDDDLLLGFVNAESGEVNGIEFEGLKTLPRGLFLSGNVTLSDSEISLGNTAQADATNRTRRLSGHSEWVVNSTLGYDSGNGKHSAYLNYNVFGERIFFAGTAGNDDAYEQPFNSLGIVYTHFPTQSLQFQLQLDNILGEDRQFEQTSATGLVVPILTQEVGTTWSLGVRWVF